MLKDPIKEKRIFTFRAILAMLFIILLAIVLVSRVYYLQIVDYEHYTTLSDKNRMQLQSVAPTRGLIYDRNGMLLADNQPVFSVSIVKERVDDLDQTIADIGRVIELSDEQIKNFRKRLNNRRKPYEPTQLKSKLTEKEIAKLTDFKSMISLKNESDKPLNLMFFGGEPYTEKMIPYGPFIMNSEKEIAQAYNDYQNGKYGEIDYSKVRL